MHLNKEAAVASQLFISNVCLLLDHQMNGLAASLGGQSVLNILLQLRLERARGNHSVSGTMACTGMVAVCAAPPVYMLLFSCDSSLLQLFTNTCHSMGLQYLSQLGLGDSGKHAETN